MNKPVPANQLFHALNKLKESNEQFHERMAKIARAAFVMGEPLDINSLDPLDPVHSRKGGVGEVDYDGDGGREWMDTQEDRR